MPCNLWIKIFSWLRRSAQTTCARMIRARISLFASATWPAARASMACTNPAEGLAPVSDSIRALRHIQRRRAFELVCAQQHHSEVLTQLAPGGVARLTLRDKNSYNAIMPECRQALPVAEYLTETDPELMFLVVGGDALDFRHEDGPVLLPDQIKVRSWRQTTAWFDSGVAQDASQLV